MDVLLFGWRRHLKGKVAGELEMSRIPAAKTLSLVQDILDPYRVAP